MRGKDTIGHAAMMLVCVLLLGAGAGLLYAAVDKPIDGRSIVYPPMISKLKFSHKLHKDVACDTCHGLAKESRLSADRLLPAETVCATCHQKEVRTDPTDQGNERCAFCHADWDATGKKLPTAIRYAKANLNFPHALHVARMIDCASCHVAMENETRNDHLPSEELCLTCHQKGTQGGRCSLCHPTLPSGQIVTKFSESKLMPTRGRLNHRDHWLDRHDDVTRAGRASCDPCHQQSFCDSCHDGVLKPLAIHPPNYSTLHPIDARKNRTRCQSCHRYSSFCVDCHKRLGVSPETNPLPERVQYHPDGWDACNLTVNHHSYQAKRNLAACASCHKEQTCIRCHTAGSSCGGRTNIHSHMSRRQLSRMKEKNPRVCRKCHEGI